MLAESDDISSGLRGVKSTRALISARVNDVNIVYTKRFHMYHFHVHNSLTVKVEEMVT